MSAHPLPMLPSPSSDIEARWDELALTETSSCVRKHEQEQTFTDERWKQIEREPRSSFHLNDVHTYRLPTSDAYDCIHLKPLKRKPLPSNDSKSPSPEITSATYGTAHNATIHDIHTPNQITDATSSLDFQDARHVQNTEVEWVTYEGTVLCRHDTSSRHVHFADTHTYFSPPQSPSPTADQLFDSRRLEYVGPRPPPWGSFEELARVRRMRIDDRASDYALSNRFEADKRRLTRVRQNEVEDIKSGKRRTEVDELRDLVSDIYPDMTFEGEERRGCRCCCLVM